MVMVVGPRVLSQLNHWVGMAEEEIDIVLHLQIRNVLAMHRPILLEMLGMLEMRCCVQASRMTACSRSVGNVIYSGFLGLKLELWTATAQRRSK